MTCAAVCKRHLCSDKTFQKLVDGVLENTLSNLMQEACLGEFDITNLSSLKFLPKYD